LVWETQGSEEAIGGMQQGLNDFEAGRFRSFDDFAAEQRSKFNLSDKARDIKLIFLALQKLK
jgi:hypothetical protein